ncbi:low temperature requirement protein A [Streptomyces sp. ZYX-F-203]|uniref:low temperature requirement protein A n=1 Tax=Streptomyces sp. HSG2 TaxID=2797167 RepID=UPI0019066B11|nr:low temperature requirement protein A [Streptomyces sp. HSG2]
MSVTSAKENTHKARHAAWLELFFDLVFVGLASQLSHGLHGDPSLAEFAVFLGLYFPPWWLWVNITVSVNLFADDTARRRLLVLSAMVFLAMMAAAVPEASGDRGAVYALGYAGTRLVLLGLWWPATRLPGKERVAVWRPVTYCLGSGLLWALSALVPTPWRHVMWAVLIAAELALLLSGTGRGLPRRLHTGYLVERVGLFVILVLGESVLALITSTDHVWTAEAGVVALLGFVLLAALWWSYFDFGAASIELLLGTAHERLTYPLSRDVAGFLHFFVTAAIISLSAGLATAVDEAGHPHLPTGALVALGGSLALYHAAHACIALRFGATIGRVAAWAVPGVALPLLVALFGEHLAPWLVVLLLTAEAVAHLLYARVTTARRRAAGSL